MLKALELLREGIEWNVLYHQNRLEERNNPEMVVDILKERLQIHTLQLEAVNKMIKEYESNN
jgi:hypothetical protein